MDHIGHCKSHRGWRRMKGFRVSSGRLSIHRLRVEFLDFIRLLRRLKSLCDQALASLKKGRRNSRKNSTSESGKALVADGRRASLPDYRFRSNSFYAEAIGDCLEFIKRTSDATNDGPTIAVHTKEVMMD